MTDSVEIIEARRAARKEALAAQAKEQRAVDLEALDALEIEHGDSSVRVLDVAFTPGLPTFAVVRCPKGPESKRYKDRLREGDKPNGIKAADELGASCLVYPPDGPVRAALLAARPMLLTTAGTSAIELASGKAEEEGKGS
jgi:hypothetical protein